MMCGVWRAATAAAAICVVFAGARAMAAEPSDELPPRTGRLWNLAAQPFSFRLQRANGATWTDPMTIAPEKYFEVRAPEPGERSDLQGITGNGRGYVVLRYPELGGQITLRLPAVNDRGKLMPQWFHVKDANGFSRVIQAASVADARAEQTRLQKEPPLAPADLERIKQMLRANWVLTDR